MMKMIQVFRLLAICLLCLSCSDNDDNNNKSSFSAKNLKQTQWVGTLQRLNAGTELNYTVGVAFYTEDAGRFSLDSSEYNFNYSIDEKMFIITNADSFTIRGNWFLVSFDGNKMELKRGTGGDGFNATMILTRTY